jgi:hypothetical protein
VALSRRSWERKHWCGRFEQKGAGSGRPGDARERGELGGAVGLAEGSSTAVAASSGAKRQR